MSVSGFSVSHSAGPLAQRIKAVGARHRLWQTSVVILYTALWNLFFVIVVIIIFIIIIITIIIIIVITISISITKDGCPYV